MQVCSDLVFSFFSRNYDSELYAFAARIGEKFDEDKLRQAFLNKSYVEKEARRQKELGIEEQSLLLETNDRLSSVGIEVVNEVLLGYLRSAFPFVPEEGIRAFRDFLTSLDILAETSFHIGTRDLIMAEVIHLLNLVLLWCIEIFFEAVACN